jgi:predicted nucleic acid-binding protein
MIAATAHANGMILATRNPDDFTSVKEIVRVIKL